MSCSHGSSGPARFGSGSKDHATGRAEEGPGGRCPEAGDDTAAVVISPHRVFGDPVGEQILGGDVPTEMEVLCF